MIEVRDLTKRYGDTVAVDDLTFDVRPGMVTGFLGPNGAGKSTTMRMVLGLDHPTAGRALIDGRPYRALAQPLRHVGALLEADTMHPSRSARDQLRIAARSNGIPTSRVDEVLEQVGLSTVADRKVKSYSLGMRQRTGIAAALLAAGGSSRTRAPATCSPPATRAPSGCALRTRRDSRAPCAGGEAPTNASRMVRCW